MLYEAVLSLHIFIAISTGVVILYALFIVAKGAASQYTLLALVLGLVAAAEVASGILLTLVSSTVTLLSLSLHMTAYLSVCFGVEALLYVAKRYRLA